MSDTASRFRRRRALLRQRGLCVRCGRHPAAPGHVKCKKCALEIVAKKIVAPGLRLWCEKIGRLERDRAILAEAQKLLESELERMRAPAVRRVSGAHSIDLRAG